MGNRRFLDYGVASSQIQRRIEINKADDSFRVKCGELGHFRSTEGMPDEVNTTQTQYIEKRFQI